MSSKYEFDPTDKNDCKTVLKILTALGYKTEDNDQYKKELEEKDKTIQELGEKLTQEQKLFQQQKDQNDELQKQLNEIQDQINSIPSKTSSTKENKLCFYVKDDKLQETSAPNRAEYLATKNEDQTLSYSFNETCDTLIQACHNYKEYIEPFCDIKLNSDDANKIITETPGIATYDFDTYVFTIKTRATVKLVKS